MSYGLGVITQESLMFIPLLSLGLNHITRKISDNFKGKKKMKGHKKAVVILFPFIKTITLLYFHLSTHTHTQPDTFIIFNSMKWQRATLACRELSVESAFKKNEGKKRFLSSDSKLDKCYF